MTFEGFGFPSAGLAVSSILEESACLNV